MRPIQAKFSPTFVFSALCLLFVITASSCGYIMRSTLTPNQCKKCEVISPSGGVAWSEEDCGGGIHNMVTRAKVAAYDLGCDYRVRCNSWTKEKTE